MQQSSLCEQIKSEISTYHQGGVPLPTGEMYSEWKLKKRIYTYKNRYYPTGKVNSNGEIEYWFDGVQPRVNDEIKNLRLDSKYFMVWHKNPIKYFAPVYIANASIAEFMDDTGRAEELMEANEDFSADGNVLFRKTDKNYEKCDLLNTYFTNTLARTVDETAIIERFYLTQSELRRRANLYDRADIDEVVKKCANTYFKPSEETLGKDKSTPRYELYRRTGEISEKQLFAAQGEEGGDDNKYVLAMVIVCGLTNSDDKDKKEYVLYAEELDGMMSDYFKEAHRGPYKGKWWREGMYELLFDQQTAYNELTNEIMRAIPWNTSAFFRHTDIRTTNSLRGKLKRGSLIKSADLQQVQVQARIQEAVAARNDLIREMDRIAGSYEVVQGVTPASGTPLGTVEILNQNTNKMYDFLRKKLAVPYRHIYREFVLLELVKDLKGKDIIRLTGDPSMLDGFRRIVAENWYLRNLPLIGPHTRETRDALIQQKILELSQQDPLIKNSKDMWKEILPGLRVTVVGESYNAAEVATAMQMVPLESDPTRRAYLLDFVYSSKGMPVPPPVQQQVNAQVSNQIPEQAPQEWQLQPTTTEVPAEALA